MTKNKCMSVLYLHNKQICTVRTVVRTTREAGLRQVTCIVLERQLRLYGHVARLPAEDPAHRIFLSRSAGLVDAETAPTRFVVA